MNPFSVERRLEFDNGWSIDVHEERDGKTFYQRWAPGVENQSMWAELMWMETPHFNEEVAKYPHATITPPSRADKANDVEEIVAALAQCCDIVDGKDPYAFIPPDFARILISDWRAKKEEIERLENSRWIDPGLRTISERAAAEAVRAKCEAIARDYETEIGELGPTTAERIADDIAALKQPPNHKDEHQ